MARADVMGTLRRVLADVKSAPVPAVDGALALVAALAATPAAKSEAGAAGAFEAVVIPLLPLILERVLDKAASSKIAAVDAAKGAPFAALARAGCDACAVAAAAATSPPPARPPVARSHHRAPVARGRAVCAVGAVRVPERQDAQVAGARATARPVIMPRCAARAQPATLFPPRPPSSQTRAAALDRIAEIAKVHFDSMPGLLPEIIPRLSEQMTDARKEVTAAATAALVAMCATIGNRDIEAVIPQVRARAASGKMGKRQRARRRP